MSRIAKYVRWAAFLWHRHVTGFSAPAAPEMDPEFLERFTALLGDAQLYLEFGSGGSTLLAARLATPTLSVESDPVFARTIRRAIAPGAEVTVLHADIGWTEARGFPLLKRPTARRLDRWRRYIALPFDHLSRRAAFPDLILVDGRFRRACALESARQARLAGRSALLLFDDYRHRPGYHAVEPLLGAPTMIGRCALFDIGPGHGHPIGEDDVARALLETE